MAANECPVANYITACTPEMGGELCLFHAAVERWADRMLMLEEFDRWYGYSPAPRPVPVPVRVIGAPVNPRGTQYGLAALRGVLAELVDMGPGMRNNALNRAAFRLGQLCGEGCLDAHQSVEALLAAADSIGLPLWEAKECIRSGVSAGLARPSHVA